MLTKRLCIIDFCHELYKSLHTLSCLGSKEFTPPVLGIGDVLPSRIAERCPGSTLALGCVQNAGFLRRKRKPAFLLAPGFHYGSCLPSLVSKERDSEASIRPQSGCNDCIDTRMTPIACSGCFEEAASHPDTQGFPGKPVSAHTNTHLMKLKQLVSFRAINSLTGLKLAYSKTAGGDADVGS